MVDKTSPIAKWLQVCYAELLTDFGAGKFSFKQAHECLGDKREKSMKVIMSDLRKAGWMHVEFDEVDHRKRTYELINPVKVIMKMKK